LGKPSYFLSIEVARSQHGVNLSQRKYVLDFCEETGLLGACLVDVPMDPNQKLLKDGELFDDPSKFRQMIGKSNYLTITGPNISYAVSVVSQFMEVPRTLHWEVVVHILRYLKRFTGRRILYNKNGNLGIEGKDSLMQIGQDPLPTEDLLLGIIHSWELTLLLRRVRSTVIA
jgi:hypothetical protein